MSYGDDCPRSRDIDNLESKVDSLDYDIRNAKDGLSQDIRNVRSGLREMISGITQDQNSDREELSTRIDELRARIYRIEKKLGLEDD